MNVLVLGGAGFIGSNIVKHLLLSKNLVTVIDGLLPFTGGNINNISNILDNIKFIQASVEDVNNIRNITNKADLIIDCMGWTSHLKALDDPFFDLKLNISSHLFLIKHLNKNQNIIYLGSRSQYGNPSTKEITEETAMSPEDLQGIHKLTAEYYYKVYSKINKFNVISLRLPNCFGENQPYQGEDIGLVGGFVRSLLNNKKIEIFGHQRKKSLLYVDDLCETILQLGHKEWKGFHPYNIRGHEILIKELVEMLIGIVGYGGYLITDMPVEIKNIDTGNAKFNDDKIRNYLGTLPCKSLHDALQNTLKYFKYCLYDSE
jgi:UDP-glucose 4-epimerase